MDPKEKHLNDLFDNPESGPDDSERPNLPEKGQVLSDSSETEDQQAQRLAKEAEDAEKGVTTRSEPKEEESEEADAPTAETDSQESELERARREAAARLKQVERLNRRDQRRKKELEEYKTRLEALEKNQSGLADEDALVQEQLAQNPVLKKLFERVESIDQRFKTPEVQLSPEELEEEYEVAQYGIDSVAAYRQHTPDWDEAYHFNRELVARERGIANWPKKERDQQLNMWEHEFSRSLMALGMDPAEAVYKMAKQSGWKPGAKAGGSVPTAPTPPPMVPDRAVRRVRDSIRSPSLSTTGSSASTNGDTITREEFYQRYTQNQRVSLFNSKNGPEIFELLDTQGRVPVSLLV
jgi:hypothetical protein